jgi:hypothetical protein
MFLRGLPWNFNGFHSVKPTAVSLLGNRLMHQPKIMVINNEILVSMTEFLRMLQNIGKFIVSVEFI